MQARDIERHLAQLGQELSERGVEKPMRVLMIGGAYMLLLAKMQRSTDDVDILWLDEEDALQRAIDALRHMKVKTRQQARRLLDRYVSPAAQATNAEEIEQALQELFPEEEP